MEHLGKGETLYWCVKRFCRPISQPEPGWGIEQRFRPLATAPDVAGGAEVADVDVAATAPDVDVAATALDVDVAATAPDVAGGGFVARSSARVVCAGDILATSAVMQADTTHLLDDVAAFFSGADLVCANLESPVAPSRPAVAMPQSLLKPLRLNHSADFVRSLLPTPISLVSLANNHALDQGPEGLVETMDFLDDIGCEHVGCARTDAERDQPHITDLNGIRVAHIAWTFSLSNKPLSPEHAYLVNYLRLNLSAVDLEPLRAQVRSARAAGAEIVIAHLHWGLEFEAYPNHALITNAHRIIELGVDVIVGNHPHHAQPWEWHSYDVRDDEGGEVAAGGAGAVAAGGDGGVAGGDGGTRTVTTRTGLIIYAQGDFASFQRGMPIATYLSALAGIELAKGRDAAGRKRAWVSGLQVMPLFPFELYDGRRCVEFRLLDLTRLARDGFSCELAGFGIHHRRRARKLWEAARRAKLSLPL
jgi:poly-gamma-glutamate capsule biosynthesis protein CapA/YwtB (metallophosphatase superfamily)